ncbi:MAG: ATP-dependent DNA helicase RecG [Candidatus Portnoybacteria bacterium]|nr:ATP-dependent DNA helicase RecG [Candidatus Portnoybacteria bacterium]
MAKYTLNTSIGELPRINEKYLKKFHKLGIINIRDLLYYFPHRYEDFSKIIPIKELEKDKIATIQGKIISIKNTRTFKKRMVITEAIIEDKSGTIKAVWFNQPFLTNNLRQGKIVSLSGKMAIGPKGPYLSSPSYELISTYKTPTHTARLVPIYPETTGISSRFIRYYVKLTLPIAKELKESIPQNILKEESLPSIQEAIKNIHFPQKIQDAEKAKKRFAFEELLLLQLFVLKQKRKIKNKKATRIPFDKELIKEFVEKLPFKLTNDQRKAAWEIFKDIDNNKPMNRLLQGDVGSGKTVVAAMASLQTTKTKNQTAFMAPTEILAQQHFKEVKKLLKGFGVKIALLTSDDSKINNKKTTKKELIEKIKNNKIDILIGTHALIQKEVEFKNLGLAIIDEQHRFGVGQRASLKNKNTTPHLLSMTATPIPRTLALTIYGDLDISFIKEMPKGRQKIKTRIVPPEQRSQAYKFIEQEIKKGRQAFVICPRIEASKKQEPISKDKKQLQIDTRKLLWQEVKAVEEEYEKLNNEIFPDLKIEMIHGKLKSKEKEKIMKDFKNKKINMLVSTSVIEVGIDIPNATVMMIEGADRFGLAQLHQFRGRVGRGENQSYCFLFSTTGQTTTRLRAIQKCEDGFELAEKDMQIRGPGQFYGIKQSGIPDLAMDSLKDLSFVKSVKKQAESLLSKDAELKTHKNLKEELKKFKEKIHLE